jgi:integrase
VSHGTLPGTVIVAYQFHYSASSRAMCVVKFQAASGGWCPTVRSGAGWSMSATHEHRGEGEGGGGIGPRVPTTSPSNPKLLTILRSKLRVGYYSRRTEQAYVSWTRRFVRHHGLVHPAELAEREVVSFLRHLAEDRHVAQATQAQALAALQFLYQHVLGRPLQLEGRLPRARTPKRLPVVLSRTEVVRVLAQLRGVYAIVGLLLYGSGLRLMECLTLRIKDVDLERGEIRIRRGKGGVDRVTVLPQNVRASLTGHLE